MQTRHTVVTTHATYTEEGLRSFLARRVEQARGDTWQDVAAKVARVGHWEFEDYADVLDQRRSAGDVSICAG